MELTEFFERRKNEQWDPHQEVRHLQMIVDDLDEGGYPPDNVANPSEGISEGIPAASKVRKWVENRRRILRSRIDGTDPRYPITQGKSGGLSTEKRKHLKERQILHNIQEEVKEMSGRLDRGVDILEIRLPPTGEHINRSQLARRTGVSTGFISRILSGHRSPSIHTLTLIAGVWGVGIEAALERIRAERARQGESKNAR